MRSKLLFISLLAFLLSSELKADHLIGGEIVWECMPSGQYRFTLTLYRDCAGIPLNGTTQSLKTNSGSDILCTKIATNYINKECNAPPCASLYNSGYIGAIEQHVYRSALITLTGTPPSTGWYFFWSSCCRPLVVDNLQNPSSTGYVLRAWMYPYTPPGASAPLSASPCYDNSPNFLESPDVSVCSGFDAEYLSLGFDKDLDSLYYDWAEPKANGTAPPWTNVTYLTASTYGFTTPLPGPSQNGNNVPAVLNNSLGRINFKSFTTGSYATCMKVSEYRYGQLIGEVFRDIPIFIKSCTPPTGACGGAANDAPSLSFGWYPGFDTLTPVIQNGKIAYYEMTVDVKTQVKFKMTGQDFNTQANCSPQTISFVGLGGNLSPAPNYNNSSNCFLQAPCATISPVSPQVGFSSFLNNDVEFNWQTSCEHLTYQAYLGGSVKNTYEFYFRFEDNACPLPAVSYATVKINVLNTQPQPPDLSNGCVSYQPNGNVVLDWLPPLDTGVNFDFYKIYRASNGGSFAAIDSITNYSTTSYTDLSAPAGISQYFMRSYGGCSLISEPSDTIQGIVLTLVANPPPPNSSWAALSWNAKWPKGPKGEMYEVWREICGSYNWQMLGTTPTLAFNDTVNVCGACLRYQIRISGSCLSKTDSGYFADQSNKDIIDIDSVSVVNNQAVLSWDTASTSSDVTDYIILKRDVNGSWIQVATVPIGSPFPYVYAASSANTESERFKVVTIDSCGNQSSDLNATSHGTIYLNVNSDPCEAFVRLRWNTYRTWSQSAVAKYEIYADITPPGGTIQNRVLVFQGGPTDSVYQHDNVMSGYEYCYYIKATDTTGLYTSTSNKVCVDALVVIKSKLLYLGHATVKDNESVEVYGFIDKDADVMDYGIERADNINGPFLVLGLIPKPTTGPWVVKFIDYGAQFTANQYFYRISSTDSCGEIDKISNIGRNILLQVNANGNLTNTLIWNPYEQWDGEVGKYEVYRQVDNNGAWTLVTDQLSATDTTFIDDIRPFGTGNGAFCYYVKAVEINNPLAFVNEFGLPFNSISNAACVSHDARVFVPTAFNPNSDVLTNRIWKPSNIFARANSYELFVMNRWGEKVFQTKNLDEGWDGNFKGSEAPLGVYSYSINYRSLEGLPIEERGSFTLIR